nr:reverse transcriptase domain protein [Colletotrichum truncatum]XP_036581771.1 reverse transcriptase domain protein [Colletotrichum truncatum]XP_036582657.1 reverse transcriptase domain protein [Colletotrichum truncatum]KAF6785108.1 reverse transcriptase domain protein [Colletotrichum truncatum]KAF6790214.1 reverse transcriptase domain protein [Colletotrichum truncatum]KAF6791448.1 reverse transcriptase domain protein [Colletotrichum truncatum]
MSSQISVLTSTTRLTCRRDFPVWYDALYAEADAADVWDLIDPDDTTSPSDPREDDEELSIESWITQQNEKQRRTYDRKRKAYDSILQHRAEASDDTGEELQEPVAQPTLTQNTPGIFERYTNYLASKSGRDVLKTRRERDFDSIQRWVKETVDKDILYAARSEILAKNQRSLRALIQYLRKRYAPSESSSQTTVREEYLLLLEKANTSVNPQTWLRDFHRVLLRALRFRIPESQGTLASKTFLRAVGHRFAPSWATSELTEIVKMERKGDRIPTVSEYRDMLEDLLYEDTLYDKNRGKTSGVYATLAGRPSEAISDGKSGSKGKGKSEACPCNKPHNANPLECTRVEYALTGRIKPSQDKLSRDECKEIRKRINQSENYDLRAELARKGWIWATEPPSFRNPAPPRNRSSGNTGSKAKSQQEENESEVTLKRNIHAVTISRELLREISDDFDSDYDQPSVFATPLTGPHVLSRSTVLDNCGATHLVNNLDLLESSSIKTCIGDERVDSGTASYPILAKGTWILPKALNGPDGDLTADLTLHNVGYVENFHVNIVSEALLRKTGIWYSGLDNTLRQGTYKNSVVVKHLVRKMNITFFEYKTGSQYIAQKRITSSNAGIVNHLVLAVQDPARLSLRKPPDRVSWDLFDYPTSFDKNRWLLVIKDEYTGRLFAFPRHNGIEIEETPPYTKEPNGGGERAGQELITRAIKMLSAAGLPTTLWVEAVMAAAYLYNMSPRKRRAWLSPIQISEPPATANPGLQFLGLAKPSELVFSLEEQPLPPAFAPSTVISEETTVKRSAVNSRREEGLLTPEPTPEPAAAPEGTDGQTTGQQSSEAMDAGVPDPGHEALSEAVEDVIYVKTNNEPPREPAVEADSSNDLGGDSPTHPVRPHSDNGNGREPEIKTKRVYNRKDYGQQQGKPRRSPRFAQHFAFLQTEQRSLHSE